MSPRLNPSIAFTIDVACTLGEGPVWDDRLQCLWWTDIAEQRLYRWSWNDRTTTRLELPERLGSLGLTSDPEWLVCAFASGFALFNPQTGAHDWLHQTEPHYRGIRMNDGRVDSRGNFWAGSMIEDAALAGDGRGTLYRLSPNGTVTHHREGIAISNAICFPPHGSSLYFADTPTGEILELPLRDDGTVGPAAPFASVQLPGHPDGAIIDAEGCLWNAEWGASQLTAYWPDGSIRHQVPLPVSQPTCMAFGGPDQDMLFVTSAREDLDEAVLRQQPDAGKVLVLAQAGRGIPAARFPLDHLRGPNC